MTDVALALMRYMSASSAMELRLMKADSDADSRISFKDAMFLNLVAMTEDCTATKLARMVDLTKPTVSARVNSLESKGLIRRTRSDEDGRQQFLGIAGQAEVAYLREFDAFRELAGRLEERFGSRRMEGFAEILDEASRMLTEEMGR